MSDAIKSEKKEKPTKKYIVRYNGTGALELKIGRIIYRFGNQHKEETVDKEFVYHPDFIQQSKYFVIKEAS